MEGYTVPLQNFTKIPVDTHLRDSLSLLDVVWSNKFEGECFSPETANELESEFYRGAPPQWLNFYWAEKEGSPLVKRDMYETLNKEINKCKCKKWSITHIDLLHEPGSGGSTLAMQTLWDWRNQFRCAKVLDSTTDMKAVARQVLQLFQAGGPEKQNTVLLLLDNLYTSDSSDDATVKKNLEDNLFNEMKAGNVTATVPVVIILNCLRQLTKTKKKTLCTSLSENESQQFKDKLEEIINKYGEKHTQFHAFNILVSNFDLSVVKEACDTLKPIKRRKRPRKAQLWAYLALLNSYAPGSYLTYDVCCQFLQKVNRSFDTFSLEQEMQPFTSILVTFSVRVGEHRNEVRHVRMAHRLIADECLRLLMEARVTRSNITRNFLSDICRDSVPLYLVKTIKNILTKREVKQEESEMIDKSEIHEKETFSRLIQDIERNEGKVMCTSVLAMPSRQFENDPFFPQALARFYYLRRGDYQRAQYWAKTAIERDYNNSFIRDTLGQVHKHHLQNLVNKSKYSARNILQIGKKAAKAFEDEAKAALQEQGPEMKEFGVTNTSTSFNNRGYFGYMQVANKIFYHLKKIKVAWSEVLTKQISPQAFFNTSSGENCGQFEAFLMSLRDQVEDKAEFFQKYCVYSKPSVDKNERNYFWPTIEECYHNYLTQNGENKTDIQILKEKQVSTFAGLLHALDTASCVLDWEEVINLMEKIHSPGDVDAAQKCVLANIILSQRNGTSESLKSLKDLQSILYKFWDDQKDHRSPEFYFLVLLLFWPGGEQIEGNTPDIAECVQYISKSFKRTYQNIFRSRYLVPLFLLKEGEGLQKLVHISQQHRGTFELDKGDEWSEIHRVQGVVQSYKVFAVNGSQKIEVSPQNPATVHDQGNVSFNLGLNIKGHVAYNIRYES